MLSPARQQGNNTGRLAFWLLHAALPALLLAALYLWTELSPLDLQFSQWIYRSGGNRFIDHWFLSTVLHEGVRAIGYVLAYALLVALLTSVLVPRLAPARLPLLFIVLSIAAGSSTVVELKHLTNVYCPSALTQFGGDRPMYSPFDISTWVTSLNNGQCWPGGHSSYGFALWPFYFIAREFRRQLAPPVFAAIFVYGNILGSVRVVQGAHFLSHQWWTALICWFITLGLYVVLLRRDLIGAGHTMREQARPLPSSMPEASSSD